MKRTKEQENAIIERVKLIMKEKGLTQKQLAEIIDIRQNHISMYLTGGIPIGESFLYSLIYKLMINPQWLENGVKPVYLSSNTEQNNANNSNGTQINNIHGDNNVSMTLPKEAWEMLQSQQKTIESQQDSVHMAQINMMEIIKTFAK